MSTIRITVACLLLALAVLVEIKSGVVIFELLLFCVAVVNVLLYCSRPKI